VLGILVRVNLCREILSSKFLDFKSKRQLQTKQILENGYVDNSRLLQAGLTVSTILIVETQNTGQALVDPADTARVE
jgi:hypothetical protein